MDDNNIYLLNIKTIQASTFKQVIDALKEILMDVNLEIDETGIKIVAMDNTHIVLIHLKLEADKFEIYECEKKKFPQEASNDIVTLKKSPAQLPNAIWH
jgi:DNA polymerase III sliding clamp (beta) subunit (PCNA family)